MSSAEQAQRAIPMWLWAMAICAILWFTWNGQQYLAQNAYNDADSSYFAYGGKVLAQGGVLYRDFWDQKPPMIFYQNALLYSCFGLDFGAWAICHGLWFLLALAWLSRVLILCGSHNGFSPRITLLWAVVVSFAFNLNNFLDFGNRTEFGLALFEMLAMGHTLLFFKFNKNSHLVLAGALCAFATLYKPTGMASLQATVALFIFVWVFKKYFEDQAEDSMKSSFQGSRLLWLFLGFFGSGALVLLPVIMTGQLTELWSATITVPLSLTGGTGKSIPQAAMECIMRMGPLWGWTWPCVLVLPYLLWKGFRRQLDVALVWLTLWTLATYSGIVLMRHGHPHYDHPLVVPLITLSLYWVAKISQHRSTWRMAILLVWCCSGLWFSKYFMVRQAKQSLSLAETQKLKTQPYRKVSLWLKEHLTHEETFYYWSMGYSPYLHSDKPCPALISPCIITLGDAGAEMIEMDLLRLQNNPQVTYLLENPETFPKYMSDPAHFKAGSKARETVEIYLRWRDQDFYPVHLPELEPFLIYRKK